MKREKYKYVNLISLNLLKSSKANIMSDRKVLAAMLGKYSQNLMSNQNKLQ